MKNKIPHSEPSTEFQQSIDGMSNEGKNNVDNTLKKINIMEKTAMEILIPDDKNFLDKLQKLADAENRSIKNWIETLVINSVNSHNKAPEAPVELMGYGFW